MERRGGMETILCVTPLGRKRTVRAKLAVIALAGYLQDDYEMKGVALNAEG